MAHGPVKVEAVWTGRIVVALAVPSRFLSLGSPWGPWRRQENFGPTFNIVNWCSPVEVSIYSSQFHPWALRRCMWRIFCWQRLGLFRPVATVQWPANLISERFIESVACSFIFWFLKENHRKPQEVWTHLHASWVSWEKFTNYESW